MFNSAKSKSVILLSLLLILSCLSACAKEPNAYRVTEEELVKLREEYPYNDTSSALSYSVPYDIAFPTFESFVTQMNTAEVLAAVVVLEFTGDWYTASNTTVKMYDDEELNQIVPGANRGVVWPVIDATVEQVVWGQGIENGENITIGFGDISVVDGQELEKCFIPGQRYVCLLEPKNSDDFGLDSLYCIGKLNAYYLTNKNVLMSIVSAKAADENSGLYLSSFETVVNETLGPPDAELTPVEPELETE